MVNKMFKLLCILLICVSQLYSANASIMARENSNSSREEKSLVYFNVNKVQRPINNLNSTFTLNKFWLAKAKLSLINSITSAIRHKMSVVQSSLVSLINLVNTGVQTLNSTSIEVNITVPKLISSSSTTTTPTTTTTSSTTTSTTTTTPRSTTISTTITTPKPNNTDPAYCDKPNNLVIILDSSGSVNNAEYKKERGFAAKIAYTWKRNPRNNIAVVIYASRADTFMDFMDSKMLTATMVRHNILNANRLTGSTKTHLALESATKLLTSQSTSTASNILLMTDGMSDNYQATVKAAKKMRNMGIKAVVVAIRTNGPELYEIAGQRENVFFAKDFDNSEQLVRPVSLKICEISS